MAKSRVAAIDSPATGLTGCQEPAAALVLPAEDHGSKVVSVSELPVLEATDQRILGRHASPKVEENALNSSMSVRSQRFPRRPAGVRSGIRIRGSTWQPRRQGSLATHMGELSCTVHVAPTRHVVPPGPETCRRSDARWEVVDSRPRGRWSPLSASTVGMVWDVWCHG